MRNKITMTVVMTLLTVLACSMAWSQDAREVRLGNYLLLRVRCPAGGYTIDERVAALQQRANNLLRANKTVMTVTVRKSGNDANIYTDDIFFMTVTPADGKANRTTAAKLARVWAERLRYVFPRSSPEKPGVGRAGQAGAPGNAQ